MTGFTDQLAVLRQLFLSRAEGEIGQLRTAMLQRDLTEVRFISHRLAGIAGVFGFAELGAAARHVEEALDRRAPAREVDRNCNALVDHLGTVLRAENRA